MTTLSAGEVLAVLRDGVRRLVVCGKAAVQCDAPRMPEAVSAWRVPLTMHARSVDEAATRLRELRQEECGDLALAAVSLGLAFAATQIRPAFAMPLLLGGVVLGVRGTIALWRRWDLVEHLAGEQEAHGIPEVLAFAAREATVERRHMYAARIRTELTETALTYRERVMIAAEELEALAAELEDDELTLVPVSAVMCRRLLTDLVESPLLNPALPPEELRSRLRQIRAGFGVSRVAA